MDFSHASSVIFDLDGTIADSAPGVVGSVQVAFQRIGIEAPPLSELMTWLGPPMIQSLRTRALLDEHTAQRVLAEYRTHYDSVGVFDAQVFAGMLPVLDALASAGIPLAVATSKPEGPALAMLEHLGLTRRFAAVRGASEPDGRSSKRDVLASALAALADAGKRGDAPVMIGDRHHDIGAAGALGIASVFTPWGYGTVEEAEGATAVVAHPSELIPLLLGR